MTTTRINTTDGIQYGQTLTIEAEHGGAMITANVVALEIMGPKTLRVTWAEDWNTGMAHSFCLDVSQIVGVGPVPIEVAAEVVALTDAGFEYDGAADEWTRNDRQDWITFARGRVRFFKSCGCGETRERTELAQVLAAFGEPCESKWCRAKMTEQPTPDTKHPGVFSVAPPADFDDIPDLQSGWAMGMDVLHAPGGGYVFKGDNGSSEHDTPAEAFEAMLDRVWAIREFYDGDLPV